MRESEREGGMDVGKREREIRLVRYWSKLAFCILVIVLNENIRLDCQKKYFSKIYSNFLVAKQL